MLEIERTYLVRQLPDNLSRFSSVEMRQGYFSDEESPLRIRMKGEKFELTKKFPIEGADVSSHEEINIPLKREEFDLLWPTVLRSLTKTRYLVPLFGNLVAELDVFRGPLEGLALVEVEFPDRKAMDSFKPPDWFGRDVTLEEFSANSYLAGKSFDKIKKDIERI